jgi:phenol 2-monooxygenase
MINEPTARYPHATTLHQGAVEDIFIQSLAEVGVQIDRPVKPIAIHISEDLKLLQDPNAHPIQLLLERIDSGDTPEEVNAKIVLGADGAHSWVRKQFGITMDGESTCKFCSLSSVMVPAVDHSE